MAMFPKKQWIAMKRKSNINENNMRWIYGKLGNYYKWDLAVSWFKMSNDSFFEAYGFNFVPDGSLYDNARKFVHNY